MTTHKNSIYALLFTCLYLNIPQAKSEYPDLSTLKWQHGTKSCKSNTAPDIQIVKANEDSFILRQNKCVNFEAPFIYVLIGRDRTMVIDTGASDDSPIKETIVSLINQQRHTTEKSNTEILVVHSHSHRDHTKGDSQFSNIKNIEVVGTTSDDLAKQLGLINWPSKQVTLNLGERPITLIPVPGHQEQSIAFYDHKTGWLITGDTFYPGSIRVQNWDAFKQSIDRLVTFSKSNPVSLILGAHIEMNAETKKLYPIGRKYQPKEPPLSLDISDLEALNSSLKEHSKPKTLKFDKFIISPLSRMQKILVKMLTKKKS